MPKEKLAVVNQYTFNSTKPITSSIGTRGSASSRSSPKSYASSFQSGASQADSEPSEVKRAMEGQKYQELKAKWASQRKGKGKVSSSSGAM